MAVIVIVIVIVIIILIVIVRLAGQGFVICTHQFSSAFIKRRPSNPPVFRCGWFKMLMILILTMAVRFVRLLSSN